MKIMNIASTNYSNSKRQNPAFGMKLFMDDATIKAIASTATVETIEEFVRLHNEIIPLKTRSNRGLSARIRRKDDGEFEASLKAVDEPMEKASLSALSADNILSTLKMLRDKLNEKLRTRYLAPENKPRLIQITDDYLYYTFGGGSLPPPKVCD